MDFEVWQFSKANGFTIVSKDADYSEMSLALGYPPKVIWIRRGNCSTDQIADLIREDFQFIQQLDSSPDLSIISIL